MRNLISRLANAGKKAVIGVSLLGALAGCGELERQACLSNNFRDFEKPNGEIAEVLDCSKSEKADPYVNQIPTASLGMDFGDGLSGKVAYLVSGTDSDGTITEARARFNGGAWEIYSNGTSFQKDIAPGTNSLESYAVDDKGAQSPIVTREFDSPREAEARERIDSLLIQRGYPEGPQVPAAPYFEKDSTFYVDSTPITPDYAMKDKFGVVENFINLGYENRQDALSDMNVISQTVIPQDTYIGIPTDEVQSILNASLTNKGL